ncbi:MAG: ATP-binding protein [Chitinophagales bacterium]
MKTIFSIMLVLFCDIIYSQNLTDSIVQVREFPKSGLVLNTGWRFYPGDDTIYTRYDYNGTDGIPVNPALQLDQLPAGIIRSGIGWFCLRLQVDSSLRNKTVGITLSLLGAAEMYFNGERVYQFGNVGKNYDDEKTQAIYARALNLRFGNNEKQIIAVRYSNHPRNLYIKTGTIPDCLRVVMFSGNENINHFSSLIEKYFLFIGITVIITLASAMLTLFFFFSFRYRKEYLSYGLYFIFTFLATLVLSSTTVGKSEDFTVNEHMTIQYGANLLYIIGVFFYFNGMYALVHIKKSKFYWFLFWYAIIVLATIPFLPFWAGIFLLLVYPLSCVETLSVYYKALRKGFRKAWILFFSKLIHLLALAILIVAVLKNDSETVALNVTISTLAPALGLIVFLAWDFANISLSLQSRIVEVEKLSTKTLAQEKEKQDILASQKNKLEMEVLERTAELSKSFSDLKATQAQLIQSEKMASLGELTAGVAHEIQNPLNFVNNFSEVNKELLGEMKQEIDNGNLEGVKAIVGNMENNEDKIIHHGKRAERIVKGMLLHSRETKGQKEPTDINALADEYLRLSYQGLRAKDKTFNATLQTNYDQNIGQTNIIPQEIGRVLLNLYNNAFYAITEKKKQLPEGYEPIISVNTKKANSKVEIRVMDNGYGIPIKALDKIFQPFFTTKPTGQGTGLGLSLSYEIIKSHGGEIRVETKEGEFAEFIIQLPTTVQV